MNKAIALFQGINFNEFLLKIIEFLFYLMILLYLVGKSFEILTIIIDIAFLIFVVKNKNLLIVFFDKYKNLFFAFGYLFIYFFIQSFFTNNISVSLSHSLGIYRFVILFFAILYVFNDREKIEKVMFLSFVIVSFVCLDAIYQYIFKIDIFGMPIYQGGRLTAWSDRPVVSLYSSEFFGFILASFFLLKDKYKKFALLSLFLLTIMILISGNRTPVLALFSTVFIVVFFTEYRKYLFIIIGITGLLFSFTFFNNELSTRYQALINPTVSNTSGRIQIYKTSFEIIKNNPFLGIGSGNFRYDFIKYYEKIYNENSKDIYEHIYLKNSPYHIHSTFLDIIVSWGFFGVILILLLSFRIYQSFIKNSSISLIASIGVIYCITPLQFAKTLSQSNWQFYTFLSLILLALINQYTKEKKLKEEI